ncbi:MAG: SLC13 family permease [Acidobacteriota bacterium]
MTWEVAVLLLLISGALVAFALELFPIEVTALTVLALLVVTGILDPEEAVSGFSNKAVITIGALFVLSRALLETGVLESGAYWLSQQVGERRWLGIAIFLAITALLSGFLNNTAIVAIFIPLALSLCRRFNMSPSKVLLPLAYVATLGGMLTVIGTSTNLLVSSLLERSGLEPIGMFELTPVAAILLVVGLVYTVLGAERLLPDRTGESLGDRYNLQAFLTEVQVSPSSRIVGRVVRDLKLPERYQINIVAILRGDRSITHDLANRIMRVGDILILETGWDNLKRFLHEQRVELLPDIRLDEQELARQGQVIVEAMIPYTSRLIGKTLKESQFAHRYGALVLALRRHGETLYTRLADIPLRASDCLLLMTSTQRLQELRINEDLQNISQLDLGITRRRFWWLPLVVLPAVVCLAALGVADVLSAALVGAILILVTGVLEPATVYRAIEWPVVFLIAAFVPVGDAMVTTGAADWLASTLVSAVHLLPAHWYSWAGLSILFLATALMTQVLSNSGTAILMVPVALSFSHTLGVDARPFMIAVCLAASADFMTPVGYQTNMMVLGPGAYRFVDYLRFGAPMTLVVWILCSVLIPVFWSF